jgi:hypothetical protein
MSQQYIRVLAEDGQPELGSLYTRITRYKIRHPNGYRALTRAVRRLMEQTGRDIVQVEHYHDEANRYGEPDRVAVFTKLNSDYALKIEGVL